MLLSTKSKIARAPDGNGGLYSSMVNNKVVEHMDGRGIGYIHIYGVDNILVKAGKYARQSEGGGGSAILSVSSRAAAHIDVLANSSMTSSGGRPSLPWGVYRQEG